MPKEDVVKTVLDWLPLFAVVATNFMSWYVQRKMSDRHKEEVARLNYKCKKLAESSDKSAQDAYISTVALSDITRWVERCLPGASRRMYTELTDMCKNPHPDECEICNRVYRAELARIDKEE